MIKALGPHDLTGQSIYEDNQGPSPVKRWAQKSRITKSVGNTAAIQAGGAIKVYRWPFSETEQTDILNLLDVNHLVGAILNGLAGFRAENLYVELLNEVGKGRRDRYVQLCKLAIPILHAEGLKVAGPSWATGDYDPEDWDAFRGLGFDAIALHAYWSTAGFTPYNALRWRGWIEDGRPVVFWQPGDPPVIVTECGRDRVRDGNPNVNEGWLPTDNSGSYGWQAASQNCTADQFIDELVRYDAAIAPFDDRDPLVLGAVVFTSSPTQDWRDKGFSTDDIAGRLADLTAPEAILWAPEVAPPPDTTPAPITPPVPNVPPVLERGVMLVDERGKLPVLAGSWPTMAYHDRHLADIEGCTIHYTAGPVGQTIRQIAEYQISNQAIPQTGAGQPFPAIAYTLAVDATGVVHICHDIKKRVWHSGAVVNGKARNATHIGIVYTGNKKPNPEQIIGIATAINWCEKQLGRELLYEGHKDAMATSCPGPDWPDWRVDIDRELARLLGGSLDDQKVDQLRAETWDQLEVFQNLAAKWRSAGWPSMAVGVESLAETGKSLVRGTKGER